MSIPICVFFRIYICRNDLPLTLKVQIIIYSFFLHAPPIFYKFCSFLIKDTIYTKLALMPWIDDNLGHTLSGLTQIGNIIAKIFQSLLFFKFILDFPYSYCYCYLIPSISLFVLLEKQINLTFDISAQIATELTTCLEIFLGLVFVHFQGYMF